MLVAALVLLVAFLAIYVPDVGHGFIADDFGWVARASHASVADLVQLFRSAPTGFFRPVVSMSFMLNRQACGISPVCYGGVNLALALACALAVAGLARARSLSPGAALLAASLWLFNWHGINMAVLWTSGRTALLFTWLATAGFVYLLRRRTMVGLCLIACAMFAKEEGVLLPLMLAAWLVVDARVHGRWSDLRTKVPLLAGAFAADAVYLLLRAGSGALTASTAPDYYRFSFTLGRLAENIPEYLDRSATFPAAVLMLLFVAGGVSPRRLRPKDADASSTYWLGLIWWVGGFAITMFLPVRSSLYACFPSVGAALVAAATASHAWEDIAPARRRPLVMAGLLMPFLLWPVYHSRNRRWVNEADLSSVSIATLGEIARTSPPGTSVLIEDNPNERPTLGAAFGSGIQVAADLLISPPLHVWLAPGPGERPADPARPVRYDVRLALKDGRLVPTP